METNVSREIDADLQRVWEIITDIDGSPRVLSGVERVERLDTGEGFGVGTRWRETRKLLGKQATEEMEVTAVDPGRSYTVHADNRGTKYTSVLRVEPLEPGRSRLSMTFGAAPSGTVGKLLAATVGRLAEPATRKMLRRDLDDIAAHAEAAPPT